IDAYRFSVGWYARLKSDIQDGEEGLTPLHSTYGTLMRGLMIACDHLASGGREEVRAGLSQEEIKRSIFAAIKTRKAARVATRGVKSDASSKQQSPESELYDYQQRMMQQQGSAFLSAPTGSGK